MATLHVMCGIPGSGKSTWAKEHLTRTDQYVSRDDIRFSYINPGEDYFSKEDDVWAEFTRRINESLELGFNVFADATHINPGSRRKLLNAVKGYDEVDIVYINTPLCTALERNELRKDTERYVPRSVIKRMSYQFEEPTFDEGFNVIYVINPDMKIEVRRSDIG